LNWDASTSAQNTAKLQADCDKIGAHLSLRRATERTCCRERSRANYRAEDGCPPPWAAAYEPKKKLYHGWHFFIVISRVLDAFIMTASITIVYFVAGRNPYFWTDQRMFIYLVIVMSQIFLSHSGCYTQSAVVSLHKQMRGFAVGMGCTVIAALGASAINGFREFANVRELGICLGTCVIFMGLMRIVISGTISCLLSRGALRVRVALVGSDDRAARIVQHLTTGLSDEITLIGLFDDTPTPHSATLESCSLLGTIDDLVAAARQIRIDQVIVTIPWAAGEYLNTVLSKLRTIPCVIALCPPDVIWDNPNSDIKRLAGIPIVTVANRRVGGEAEIIKWLEDIILATILLILLAPALISIAILVKMDSPGPIIFRQRRLGYNNQIFEILKFRTMHRAVSDNGDLRQATQHDPRVTRIGKYLRRASLDELPQLINVLRGEMSLVGPRPHALEHNVAFASKVREYFARHNFKPGITGWAQINGLRGEIVTPEWIQARVEHDIYYIENWSLSLDFKIILRTVMSVWFQRTAY
jgi:Undecaprenyl-phosphate glucose phosphotransferase